MTNQNDNNDIKPKHVAIIMDGNGRWATKRLMPRVSGHKHAINSVRNAIEFAVEQGIQALTLFAFGIENWKRPLLEVNSLMSLFSTHLKSELEIMQKNNVRFSVIGDRSKLSEKLQAEINDLELKTVPNSGLRLNVAISYSGKWDITETCKLLANKFKLDQIKLDDITEELISKTLCLGDLPAPDLLIRTSGEYRLSNFLIWQLAYSELYFTEVLWPDFSKEDFAKALDSFATRQRRFGRTPEQIASKASKD